MNTCFFIGHRDAPDKVLPLLEEEVERHITAYGVRDFVVGRYGNFDALAAHAVVCAKERHPGIRLMHIDASGLVAALKKAPEERLTQDRDVSEYVMEHIFLPLRRGEPVVFADLDFEAFTDEDIWGLRGWIEHRERIAYRLSDLAKIFCGAKPVSRTGRAFC